MKVIFLKPGKYRNDISVIEVTGKDVDKKTVFDVAAKQAIYFENSGSLSLVKDPVKKKPDSADFKEESKKTKKK